MAVLILLDRGFVRCSSCKRNWVSTKLLRVGRNPVQCRFCHVKFKK